MIGGKRCRNIGTPPLPFPWALYPRGGENCHFVQQRPSSLWETEIKPSPSLQRWSGALAIKTSGQIGIQGETQNSVELVVRSRIIPDAAEVALIRVARLTTRASPRPKKATARGRLHMYKYFDLRIQRKGFADLPSRVEPLPSPQVESLCLNEAIRA
ncbi:hypothetical protein ACRALDRAFT_209806 [Sodiomyces alcalophilus JCM 7366]|uniref:uncharacterized protein n=1 Tax=Sodiomyces alcalophilus JCM 7366 TaxID=591952 RepID=UPI0039B5FA81